MYYTKHFIPNVVMTPGVIDFADRCGCHWFTDIVASALGEAARVDELCRTMQFWDLIQDKGQDSGQGAVVTCRGDSDRDIAYLQEVEYTDFPFDDEDDRRIWAAWQAGVWVLMRPSEY